MTFDILEGDVLERLAGLPGNSFDAVLSDPPYGLLFMGKQWDRGVPSTRVWSEILRVLKPGGHVLSFGGTRTFHRQCVNIEDAGFEVRDCLMWLYGSGFPKSHNVSKAIDAEAGAAREVVGRSPWDARKPNGSRGMNSVGLSESPGGGDVTAPATPLAQTWDGYGTALKPGWEPITLARKPLDGTVAANVAKWGVGGLAIDACRIGTDPMPKTRSNGIAVSSNVGMAGGNTGRVSAGVAAGRWPANVILDEDAGALLDEQSGDRPGMSGCGCHREGYGGGMFGGIDGNAAHARADSGGASRFFYSAKVSRAEREAGCEQLKRLSSKEISGREEGAAGAKHGRGGAAANGGVSNGHPTLKPIALTTYLAKLLLPPNAGRILVPYSGAGSEMIGCLKAGWPDVVGIELSPEYIEIARARITHALAEAPKKERRRKATRPPRKRPAEPQPTVVVSSADGRQLGLFES